MARKKGIFNGWPKEALYGVIGLAVVVALYFWKKLRGGLEQVFTLGTANREIEERAKLGGINAPDPSKPVNRAMAESAVDAWYQATSKSKPWYNVNDSESEMVEALRGLKTANDVVYAAEYCRKTYNLSLKTYTLGTISAKQRADIPFVVRENWS